MSQQEVQAVNWPASMIVDHLHEIYELFLYSSPSLLDSPARLYEKTVILRGFQEPVMTGLSWVMPPAGDHLQMTKLR
jgi:hypothetical protein